MTKQILIDEDTVKLALEALEHGLQYVVIHSANKYRMEYEKSITSLRQAIAEAEKQEQKQEPKPFGYTLEETMKCWDLGYAAAVKALAKQEQGEPVGEMQLSAIYEGMVVPVVPVELPAGTKLYTTPQPSQPKQEQSVSVSTEHVGEPDLDAICQDLQEKTYTQAMRIADLEKDLTVSYIRGHEDGKKAAKQEQSTECVGEPVGDGIDEAAFLERFQQNLDRGHKPCQTCEALARTVMLDQSSHDTTPYVPTGRQQRKPLTDEQIYAIQTSASFTWKGFARAIEAAHGITEE
jgi:hypothetical protein